MGVKINLHVTLRQHTGGQAVLEEKGATVGECLKNLVEKYPGLGPAVFDKKGGLNSVVEIYVNMQSAYPNELAKPMKDGDEMHVTMLLAGG